MSYTRLLAVTLSATIGCLAQNEGPTTAAAQDHSASAAAAAFTPPTTCQLCLGDEDCGAGVCAQYAEDIYCAADCSQTACPAGLQCQSLSDSDGRSVNACVPLSGSCEANTVMFNAARAKVAVSISPTQAALAPGQTMQFIATETGSKKPGINWTASGGTVDTQGNFTAPNHAGTFTVTATAKTTSHATASAQVTVASASGCIPTCAGDLCGSSDGCGSTCQPGSGCAQGGNVGVGPQGGTLDNLSFAIIGDTRPPVIEDTKGYPTAIISKIYQDIQAENVGFALTTGDYVFAKPAGQQASPQFDIYLGARANFSGTVFFTMGNHECTGGAESNCGAAGADGVTNNYAAFVAKLLSTIGRQDPYYRVRIDATDRSWSAKFVFVAVNAWSSEQGAWLDKTLASEPTTYTFIVRHQSRTVPGSAVTAINGIMDKHPYTVLLAGHTHTFAYKAASREVITGIGGAPLVSGSTTGTSWGSGAVMGPSPLPSTTIRRTPCNRVLL